MIMLAVSMLVAGMCGCKSQAPAVGKVPTPVIGGGVRAMPRAIVYQVSRADCADLVPITLTADGKGVLSYPAPSDLTADQRPVSLGDGWWLDRRGIGPTSVFTTYTYERYAAMKQAPGIGELMDHIDREARITRMVSLPVSAAEAAADPALARAYAEDGFAGCTVIMGGE